jgi:hypothetical protein
MSSDWGKISLLERSSNRQRNSAQADHFDVILARSDPAGQLWVSLSGLADPARPQACRLWC